MRVDFVCDVAARMTEDAAHGVWIGTSVIEKSGAGMTAVVCCVPAAVDEIHHAPPYGAVSLVIVRPAVWISDHPVSGALHSRLDKRPNTIVNGDDADTGCRL